MERRKRHLAFDLSLLIQSDVLKLELKSHESQRTQDNPIRHFSQTLDNALSL